MAGRPQVKLSRIVLPTEHGSWSFMLEPLVAGSAIAFSTAAPWIFVGTIAAFLVRQPLKVLFLSKNNAPVSRTALRFFGVFLALAAVSFAAAAWTAGPVILYPFAVAMPLAMQQIFFDVSKRNRNLLAEVSGAIAISSSAAALLLAGGLTGPQAIGLWLVFICRFVPSILYVRERLLLEKGKQFEWWLPVLAHLAGLGATVMLTSLGLASWLTVGVMAFLAVRAAFGLSIYRTRMKAMKIGVCEVVYGATFLASVIAGQYLGV